MTTTKTLLLHHLRRKKDYETSVFPLLFALRLRQTTEHDGELMLRRILSDDTKGTELLDAYLLDAYLLFNAMETKMAENLTSSWRE